MIAALRLDILASRDVDLASLKEKWTHALLRIILSTFKGSGLGIGKTPFNCVRDLDDDGLEAFIQNCVLIVEYLAFPTQALVV